MDRLQARQSRVNEEKNCNTEQAEPEDGLIIVVSGEGMRTSVTTRHTAASSHLFTHRRCEGARGKGEGIVKGGLSKSFRR